VQIRYIKRHKENKISSIHASSDTTDPMNTYLNAQMDRRGCLVSAARTSCWRCSPVAPHPVPESRGLHVDHIVQVGRAIVIVLLCGCR
jgi:hypothetical protein